jgi:hypothetical protein
LYHSVFAGFRTKRRTLIRAHPISTPWLKALHVAAHSIFYNYAAAPISIKGAEKRFRALRDRAELDATSSQLRDGAYTAAVEANVTSNLCQLLVGHRSGIADHSVKRKPTMVAPACEAIRTLYGPFGTHADQSR